MMLSVYGLKKCTTCQKAEKWLQDQHIPYSFQDVKEQPPTPTQLTEWSVALGGWEKLINRAGYTWRGLSDGDKADLDEAKALDLARKHPSLIRRPLIVYADGSVSVGFSEKVRGKISGL